MAGTHSRLSASSSRRWIECPGSLALSALVPAEEESEFAAEGSSAHALADACLNSANDAWTQIGEVFDGHEGFPVTAEMAEAVQVYLDYVRERYIAQTKLLIEHRIECPELGADFGGTADAVIYHRPKAGAGYVHVLDYKHGAGVAVDVEDNTQMLYYAYGVLRNLGVERGENISVGTTIVQPRAIHEEGPIRECWRTSDEVLEWGDSILLPAMLAVDMPDAPLNLGDHCRWCPAKLICPKQQENFESLAEGAETVGVTALTDVLLGEEYAKIEAAMAYIKALRDECFRRAMAGAPVPGTKLVAGRADRVFKDGAEGAAKAALGASAYSEPEFKSPAQIEKTCVGGKAFVAEWAHKKEGNPLLVSLDDRRAAVSPSHGASVFASIAAG